MTAQAIPSEQPFFEALFFNDGKEKTFKYDESTPALPIPTLEQTMERYLYWAKPHLTSEEYEKTEEIVRKFQLGIGSDLHAKLLAHASNKKNWLEDWWLHYAYLLVRDPILPTMNTTGPLPLNLTIWKPTDEDVTDRCALYLWSALRIYKAIREQRLHPQVSKDGQRFCMNQFRYVFNTTRIPGQDADSLYHTWKSEEEGDCPTHIIVLCHGHIWLMNPWDDKGNSMTPPELETQLRHIRETSDEMGKGPGVPVLTCDNRNNWAQNRDWLKSISLNNMTCLNTIESAAFVYVLDDSKPSNYSELCWEGLCGDTTNRWADKSTTCIMTRNGMGTMNNDHTPYDAMVSVVLCHYTVMLMEEWGGKWSGSPSVRNFPMPNLLQFDMDMKIIQAIDEAKANSLHYTQNVAVTHYVFDKYGKDLMKLHRLHPDAYVQMALQLSYQRMHNKPAPTYETATTRQFYHGRTETMRSCTIESTEWTHSMLDPKATNAEKRQKLITAIKTHISLMSECTKNEGIDRHMFGLYCIAVEHGIDIPEIFTDPAYAKSGGAGNFLISSSTVGYTPVVGGVAPMVKDGYGCFYSMMPTSLNFFISSFKNSEEAKAEEFIKALEKSLQEMREVLSVPSSNL